MPRTGCSAPSARRKGFRRITFFPDRPDVLSTYPVRMEGDKAAFPVLLSNGNCTAQGEGADGTPLGRMARSLAQAVLPVRAGRGRSGRQLRQLHHDVGPRGRAATSGCAPATWTAPTTRWNRSSASMKWDEEVFGREYDLDLFNIVAVSDFNMGAMENKGLNVFNTRYVLADPDTATDARFRRGRRRDRARIFPQLVGQPRHLPRLVPAEPQGRLHRAARPAVLRRTWAARRSSGSRMCGCCARRSSPRIPGRSPTRSGPTATTRSRNFYTATVYNKGAEVIRMMRTMAGPERFRAGTDLYFDRHDGEAATCEDFVKAIEDGAGLDLAQFRRWYSQAGTPRVTARLQPSRATRATLHLEQTVPRTPGQPDKQPMPIPLRVAVFERETGKHRGEAADRAGRG